MSELLSQPWTPIALIAIIVVTFSVIKAIKKK